MDWHRVFIATFSLYASICYGGGKTLTEILSTYDTLNKADIQHRIFRRSVNDLHERTIDFSSHGKKFYMKLVQSREIFHPSFQAVSVDRFGNKTPVYVNMDYFYNGYVVNDPASHVTAHLEEDGMLTAMVEMADDTYVVEPMWRHVDKNPSHDMIVYKASDVKWNETNFNNHHDGGEPHINVCGNNDTRTDELDQNGKRVRRAADLCDRNENYENPNNTCQLKLIADYKFFEHIGRKIEQTAIHYMAQVINRVNSIYRSTCWIGIGKGIGVQVKTIEVLTEPSDEYSFNTKKEQSMETLLSELSRSDLSDYCLAHLFTYQDFKHGAIGLAYIATKDSHVAGICAAKDEKGQYFNCALTTGVNWGRTLTTLEATLVTAHEIGHNFGAKHDSEMCSPNGKLGNYVMYATSVMGEKENNQKFSKCSRKSIGSVLKIRAAGCLKVKGGRCGNGIVEEDKEECDAGTRTEDACCKQDCTLIDGAECSDYNHLCCTNCTIANTNKMCKESFPHECENETKCDGKSKDCPEQAPKLTTGSCHLPSFRKGNCSANGKCVTLCGLANLESCSCSPGLNACKVCCKARNSSAVKCQPYQSDIAENDGVHCNVDDGVEGQCDEGACEKLQRSITDAFEDLDFSFKAIKIMQNNIVITILFFSLLIWIPAGCIVNRLDQKNEERRWYKREMSNNQFVTCVANMEEPKGTFKKKDGENIRFSNGHSVGT